VLLQELSSLGSASDWKPNDDFLYIPEAVAEVVSSNQLQKACELTLLLATRTSNLQREFHPVVERLLSCLPQHVYSILEPLLQVEYQRDFGSDLQC
jgi:hypothetical protein